jgi:hypothetical protein
MKVARFKFAGERFACGANAHLSDDENVVKMGHPHDGACYGHMAKGIEFES